MDINESHPNAKSNLKNRTEILEYSLTIEDAIDSLLLMYLGIYDKKKSKGPQVSKTKFNVSFQSKIDLLFDIDVLSKEEHSDLELLMNFRNKFLHEIRCNSYLSVVNLFDNGIKNRFKKYLNKNGSIEEEDSCKWGCFNLYGKNLQTIQKKVKEKIDQTQDKASLVNTLLAKNVRMIDMSFGFVTDLLKEMKKAELENRKIRALVSLVASKCKDYTDGIGVDRRMAKLDKRMKKLLSEERIKKYLK
ncbi:MAG: hypothetical protein PHN89_05585 [Candidatus Pacebacteria bacterium]|nr:hypothetical protein [Candidatus Paceibacterota bacterium]MDD5251155.1 hypothetical protein [Patescibacteria group bacterium]